MKHILLTLTIFFGAAASIGGEKFTAAWVEENNITLEKLIEISNQSNAEEKFQIAHNLLELGSWAFKTEKKSSLNAARSLILHEAAAMGHARAQFFLSLDYAGGNMGFEQNQKLAELWLKRALSNGYQADAYHSNPNRFSNRKIYECSVNLETVTGLSGTKTKNPDLGFWIISEYGDLTLFFSEGERTQQFNCVKTTIFNDIGPFLQKQCIDETSDGIAQYFMTSDNRSGYKPGPSANLPYSWVVGLADLVTIRQGNCSFLGND